MSGGAVRFASEGREGARSSWTPEFLALAGAAGTEVPFVLEVRTRFQVWTDTAAFAVTRRPDVTPPRVEHLRLSPAGDGLIVRVSRRHILEGSGIRRASARIRGLPDSTLLAEVSMVEEDAVYEARWEGPSGKYSVSVVVEDDNGNVGESEASRIEIGAADEPLRVVEPVGPDPGLGPYLAGDWRPEGPGLPLAARLREIHPAAGGAWYGRTTWRVWRSPDEGATWQPASFMLSGRDRGWNVYGFADLARTVQGDVEDPLTAYVVEGRPYSGGFEGIFATLDGGATWSAVPVPEGVQAAFVDDHLPDRLYAGSVGAVFVSDDGGQEWREFAVEGRALGVWSHPADPGRTYAWVDSLEGGRGLWRLDGDGARGVGTVPVSSGLALPIPDPWTPGGFYIHRWKELFHTSDEGATWRPIVPDVASAIRGLAVSDSEPGLIYAHGDRLLYRSQDGGETWQGTGARFDRYELVTKVSAFGPSGLVVQTDEGVYVSTDWGETAVPVAAEEAGPPAGTLWFDHLDRLNVATILSRDGAQYMGIHRLEGGDWEGIESWEALPWLGGAWQVVYQAPWAGEVLIAQLPATTGYLRSTTGGATWDYLRSSGVIGLPHGTDPFLHRPTIFSDLSRPGVIYLADAGLWISFDHGENWEKMGPYADREDPSVRDYEELGNLRPAGALLASPDTLAVLYGDSLWVGHKEGRDWRVAGRLEAGVSGLDLARHPDEAGVLYAAADAGCYVSADGGRTWDRVLEPRTGSWRTARLRGHPHDADALYLAADRELYHSPDRGSTWRALDAGYPGVPWINDVAVDPLDPSTLYVATSAGLFSLESRPTSVAVEAALPRTTELLSSYPNPFNASTVIPFRLGADADVRIDIFNLLGQRVRRLLGERRAPGLHKVSWNGTDDRGSPVSSGVYFYRLTTGEVAETRRCMLIR